MEFISEINELFSMNYFDDSFDSEDNLYEQAQTVLESYGIEQINEWFINHLKNDCSNLDDIYNNINLYYFYAYDEEPMKSPIDFVAMKGNKKAFIQVCYLLASDDVIDREFGAFMSVKDQSPKYVFSLDKFDMSRDGITHINIEDWLTDKIDIILS